MPSCRHTAIAAGLALALTAGGVQLTTTAASAVPSADRASVQGAGTFDGSLPAPSSYDKADFYDGSDADSGVAALSARGRAGLAPAALSDEMKYFAKYESSRNYDQGFSYGDGYNALGYYQFDRRYGLVSFMRACLDYDAETYAAFAPIVSRGSEVSTGTIYDRDARKLTELGSAIEAAWHQAYAANPTEFSALQDAWAYQQYYLPTAVWFEGQGISLDGRADCVRGLVWGASNLFGPTGARWFFTGAGLSADMGDEEFVTALCEFIVDNVAVRYPAQSQYWNGWQRRYRAELAECGAYLAAAGERADSAGGDAGEDAPGSDDADGEGPETDGSDSDASESGGADGKPATSPSTPAAGQAPSADRAPSADQAPSTDGSSPGAGETNGPGSGANLATPSVSGGSGLSDESKTPTGPATPTGSATPGEPATPGAGASDENETSAVPTTPGGGSSDEHASSGERDAATDEGEDGTEPETDADGDGEPSADDGEEDANGGTEPRGGGSDDEHLSSEDDGSSGAEAASGDGSGPGSGDACEDDSDAVGGGDAGEGDGDTGSGVGSRLPQTSDAAILGTLASGVMVAGGIGVATAGIKMRMR